MFRSLFLALLMGACFSSLSAQRLYWINGPGDWDDPNHWSFDSGRENSGPAGRVPNASTDAVIDDFSGLSAAESLRIPPGEHPVARLVVTPRVAFTLSFDGVPGNLAQLMLHSDLQLSMTTELSYSQSNTVVNRWNFVGAGIHRLRTYGKNLQNVQFLGAEGTYRLEDELRVDNLLRMVRGTWETNGYAVTAGKVLFQNDDSLGEPFTKQVNTGGTEFTVGEWFARLTYGSLTVSGAHHIRASIFIGQPAQPGGPPPVYDRVTLTELPDPPQGIWLISANNFECTDCILNQLEIEDTGGTQLADAFTVLGDFIIHTTGLNVRFNAGGSRANHATFAGRFITPPAGDCGERVALISAASADFEFRRASGTLTVSDAELFGIRAQEGTAAFEAANCILVDNTSGWTVVSAPQSKSFVWYGPSDGSMGDWDEIANWYYSNGQRADCLPTLADDVTVDNQARGSLRIPPDYTAQCRNFIWTNRAGRSLKINEPGQPSTRTLLRISGDLLLTGDPQIETHPPAYIAFNSSTQNRILSRNTQLPRLSFRGQSGQWTFSSDLSATSIGVISGHLSTSGREVVVGEWRTGPDGLVSYDFTNSTIRAATLLEIAFFDADQVTTTAVGSHLFCQSLSASSQALWDVTLLNPTTTTLSPLPQSFHRLFLEGAAVRTNAAVTVDSLIFIADNSVLEIARNHPLQLNGGIRTETPAGSPGAIRSTVSGRQASIVKDGDACIEGPLVITDIDASGIVGNTHARDVTDGGNNTGMLFTGYPDANSALYWAGGDGQLTDATKWSVIAGGCPTTLDPSAAGLLVFRQPPGMSSPRITANSSASYAKIRFDSAATDNYQFQLLQDLEVGTIEMKDSRVTVGSTIGTHTITVEDSLNLAGGVGWGVVHLEDADLLLSPDAEVQSENFLQYVENAEDGRLIQEVDQGGTFYFPLGETSTQTYRRPLTVQVDGSDFNNARLIPYGQTGMPPNLPDYVEHYLERYWELTAEGIDGYSATLTGEYWTSDVVGDASELLPAFYTAQGWYYGDAPSQNRGQTDPSLTATTSFTQALFTGTNSQLLPVTLVDISAVLLDKVSARLDWRTAAEQNTSHFTIQRSRDGSQWADLGQLAAAGESEVITSYSFTDESLEGPGSYFYRLDMVDLDGSREFSPVVSVRSTEVNNDSQVVPNPTTGPVRLLAGNATITELRVVDATGRVLLTGTQNEVDLSSLPAGIYHIFGESATGRRIGRVVKLD